MKALKKYTFEPDYAVPPGKTLLEVMEFLYMTPKEIHARTGITVNSLNQIATGEQPITHEIANHLELATGVPAGLWNNLEKQYRELLAGAGEG